MKIYTVKINDKVEKNIFDELLSFLTDEEQKKILRFRRYEDALRGLTSNILLRFIIVSLCKKKNNSIQLYKNEYGKPYIKDIDNFHFNLSHSGDWIVCAVDSATIGIDIEKIHDVDLNLSARFFSKEEHLYLLSLDDIKRREAFFDFWTLKESYIKADGRGLSLPLNSFSFKLEGNSIFFTTANELKDCYFKQYNIDKAYKMSVCSMNSDFPEDLTDISFYDLHSIAKVRLT
ncbi:MAG: 4'-phosphopantetheinyl transferase sfp [Firmicutes bacterium ADurb.Bin419]|nr:MAG: 4'-phosphopantetheinyl transferase sfp [Firmicutes bacterium ADurb.Bin419]